MVCTFFGHKDAPSTIKENLMQTIIDLIENKNVDKFYVGNQGNYDRMVYLILKELSTSYPINFEIVLAYIPVNNPEINKEYSGYTSIPEGIENVPKRFAISYRNKWMVENSDFVITYVRHKTGGANKFKEIAERKHKTVINI